MTTYTKPEIVFASNNAHKLAELRELAGDSYTILSLADIGCHDDIPETAPTIAGNAMMKAQYVHDKYGKDCFADDTGLLVDALNGEPGVYSARYASAEGTIRRPICANCWPISKVLPIARRISLR